MPMFKLSFHNNLPFSPLGDLSDMMGLDDSSFRMVMDKVIHNAVIEVNAVVTMVIMQYGCASRCSPPRQVDFVVDHMYAYIIMEDETDGIVLAGHVVDPSRES
ncbi:hypothetical protein D1007_41700 [Hordeum vulgare]|nr:hypothetical protein D1007_41700 [Hordeum vulgare]